MELGELKVNKDGVLIEEKNTFGITYEISGVYGNSPKYLFWYIQF